MVYCDPSAHINGWIATSRPSGLKVTNIWPATRTVTGKPKVKPVEVLNKEKNRWSLRSWFLFLLSDAVFSSLVRHPVANTKFWAWHCLWNLCIYAKVSVGPILCVTSHNNRKPDSWLWSRISHHVMNDTEARIHVLSTIATGEPKGINQVNRRRLAMIHRQYCSSVEASFDRIESHWDLSKLQSQKVYSSAYRRRQQIKWLPCIHNV